MIKSTLPGPFQLELFPEIYFPHSAEVVCARIHETY
jgi:hypothetical protein